MTHLSLLFTLLPQNTDHVVVVFNKETEDFQRNRVFWQPMVIERSRKIGGFSLCVIWHKIRLTEGTRLKCESCEKGIGALWRNEESFKNDSAHFGINNLTKKEKKTPKLRKLEGNRQQGVGGSNLQNFLRQNGLLQKHRTKVRSNKVLLSSAAF